ncbi:MAG: hypothetical protein ACOYI3_02565 [Christensenellales bacterium]|jgi:hypothetical protein
MEKLLFKKKVDRSLLKDGLTLPVDKQDAVLNAVGAVLGKGSRATVNVIIDGTCYHATLTHVNFSESPRTVYQIRYSIGSAIGKKLNQIFIGSFPSSYAEPYVEIWTDGNRNLEFRCFPNTVKSSFMDYLGAVDSLFGYQKSYKLVFYKCFFSEALYEQAIDVKTLTKAFRQFYIDRVRFGKIPDKNVDEVIANPISSSEDDVLSLILRNPFNAVSKKGFWTLENIGDKKCFCMNDTLYHELKDTDLEAVRNIVYQKLILYYSKLSSER